jgi:aerobactin synthase
VRADLSAWWWEADRRRLARLLGELSFEGMLSPVPEGEGWALVLASGATWRFRATPSLWGGVVVEPGSVVREGPPGAPGCDTGRFLLDARQELELTGMVLGPLLEELHATLFAEAHQLQVLSVTDASALALGPRPALERALDAHPKLLGNRGRLGFSASDTLSYGPEGEGGLRLRWVAVAREMAVLVRGPVEEEALWPQDLVSRPWDAYVPVPVHPWQWDHLVRVQHAAALAEGWMVDLGEGRARYLPQQSVRTLAPADDPGAPEIKTALSILNTSCHRGIAARHAASGPALGAWLAELCRSDEALADVVILQDLAGVHVPHPLHQAVPDAAYRYHELLGAVWREPVGRSLRPGERAVPAAALHQRDLAGRALLLEWVAASGLTLQRWLERLFEGMVVPLYHLLCRYGVGIVAHGQNVQLVLREHVPVRVVLKDVHGDMRLLEGVPAPDEVSSALSRLPPRVILHDLYTGCFVSVLRFVSHLLAQDAALPEATFYRTLAAALSAYQGRHPELAAQFSLLDPFRPTMERICLNRSRFRIGYGDLASRPTPELGPPIHNPLCNPG